MEYNYSFKNQTLRVVLPDGEVVTLKGDEAKQTLIKIYNEDYKG